MVRELSNDNYKKKWIEDYQDLNENLFLQNQPLILEIMR